jgi:hypothetical protein
MVSFRGRGPRHAFADTRMVIAAGGLRAVPSPAKAARADIATLLSCRAFLDLAPPLFGFEFSHLNRSFVGLTKVRWTSGAADGCKCRPRGVSAGIMGIFWTREWLAPLRARKLSPAAGFRTIRIHPKRWNMNSSLPRQIQAGKINPPNERPEPQSWGLRPIGAGFFLPGPKKNLREHARAGQCGRNFAVEAACSGRARPRFAGAAGYDSEDCPKATQGEPIRPPHGLARRRAEPAAGGRAGQWCVAGWILNS